jgi:hypothetical protein
MIIMMIYRHIKNGGFPWLQYVTTNLRVDHTLSPTSYIASKQAWLSGKHVQSDICFHMFSKSAE